MIRLPWIGAVALLLLIILPVQAAAAEPVSFAVTGATTYPGEVVLLRAENVPAGAAITAASNLEDLPGIRFYDEGNGVQRALLPVSYYNEPGRYALRLTCGDISQTFPITVQSKEFPVQHLAVAEETLRETAASQQAGDEYESVMDEILPVADAARYWQDFVRPVQGPLSTQFGAIRYTNGSATATRHSGMDFAVPRGTGVTATANGRVLFAGALQLTGNTVVLEHGYGLKSWYYHMDSLDVRTGEMVSQGRQVGTVGSTGFSTGPHLHFGFSVHSVFVNPTTILASDLLR